jgi:hypothetical protein
MRKEKSWTRINYELAYRLTRREEGEPTKNTWHPIPNEIWRAADYSYQAYGYDVHGWSNDARRKRFHAIKYRAFAFAEDIPF